MPPTKKRMQEYFDLDQSVLIEKTISHTRSVCKIVGARDPHFLLIEVPNSNAQTFFFTANEKCIVRFMSQGSVFGFRAKVVKTISDPFTMLILQYPNEYEEITVRNSRRVECNIGLTIETPSPDAEEPRKPAEKTVGEIEEKPDEGESEKPAKPAGIATEPGQTEEGDKMEGRECKKTEDDLSGSSALAFDATIVDMSIGGFRVAVPIVDQGMPPSLVRQTFPTMSPALYENHRFQALCAALAQGNRVLLKFELPDPGQGIFEEVQGIVSWARRRGDYLFVGVRFVEQPDLLQENIQSIIEHQKTFFTSQIPLP
ncbi:flagellar brake protein [bacterium]|nr:flagellar brake protein [bacterium]